MYDSQRDGRDGDNVPSKKLYIGNLNYQTTKEALAEFLSNTVSSITAVDVFIIPNKGFGFAEFSSVEDATKVKDICNGQKLDGRDLRINFAKEQKPREQRSGGFGGNRSGGFGRR
ncbi:MAG: hypothetical protein Fur0024_3570 [Patescibacteria group bacterium]